MGNSALPEAVHVKLDQHLRLKLYKPISGERRGCHSAYLDTFSFEAPEFYLKLGREIFGALEPFPDAQN